MIGGRNVEVCAAVGSAGGTCCAGLDANGAGCGCYEYRAAQRCPRPRWQIHRLGPNSAVSLVGTRGGLGDAARPALPIFLGDRTFGAATRRYGVAVRVRNALIARLGINALVAAEADDMAHLRLLARENAGLAVLHRIVVRR